MAARGPYPLNQSPLFKIGSPKKLAEVLSVELHTLEALVIAGKKNYRVFSLDQAGGKTRVIEHPKPRTQSIHKRIGQLLSRIEYPHYLQSSVKGRSYISNGRAHIGSSPMVKVDVRHFFPSVEKFAVYQFFFNEMQCAGDVAGLLANILTVDGHLSTGSSASPILSFYAHKPLFDELNQMANERGLLMSLYVDDMCFSGAQANRKFLFEVRRVITRHGLRSHKAHCFPARSAKEVTGTIVTAGGLKLPNRRHLLIKEGLDALEVAKDNKEKIDILGPLISRVHEAAQIEEHWLPKARALVMMKRRLVQQLIS